MLEGHRQRLAHARDRSRGRRGRSHAISASTTVRQRALRPACCAPTWAASTCAGPSARSTASMSSGYARDRARELEALDNEYNEIVGKGPKETNSEPSHSFETRLGSVRSLALVSAVPQRPQAPGVRSGKRAPREKPAQACCGEAPGRLRGPRHRHQGRLHAKTTGAAKPRTPCGRAARHADRRSHAPGATTTARLARPTTPAPRHRGGNRPQHDGRQLRAPAKACPGRREAEAELPSFLNTVDNAHQGSSAQGAHARRRSRRSTRWRRSSRPSPAQRCPSRHRDGHPAPRLPARAPRAHARPTRARSRPKKPSKTPPPLSAIELFREVHRAIPR